MSEKIIEMTPKQFRALVTEMVKQEITKRKKAMVKESYGLGENEEGSEGSPENLAARDEILAVLKTRTGAGSKVKPDYSNAFIKFMNNFADSNNLQTLKGVSSLEDLADRIAKNFASTGKIDKAKKYADDLTTKFVTAKGQEKANKYAQAAQAKGDEEFKGKEEEILELIDTKLGNYSKTAKRPKAELVKAFVSWIKKNYPESVDLSDDTPTAMAKYADLFSGDQIPMGKSVQGDIRAFLDTNRAAWGIDKTIAAAEKEPEGEEGSAETGKTYSTVTDVDGAKLREIGKAIGVSEKAVNDILSALPAGKVNALFNVIAGMVVKGNSENAKRTIETYEEITRRAITMATKEFLLVLDDAIDATPADEDLSLYTLLSVMDEKGMHEGMTEGEIKDEAAGLQRIIQIMEDPQYADGDMWKALVAGMLEEDLRNSKIKAKTKDGVVKTENVFKSFQNLVAKAVSMIDPASFKKGGAGRPTAAQKAKADAAAVAAAELGRTGKVRVSDEK